jgi:hypothetical protein
VTTGGDDDDGDDYLAQIDPFTRAWSRGVELAGSKYLRHDSSNSYTVMPPYVDDIKKDLERLPTGRNFSGTRSIRGVGHAVQMRNMLADRTIGPLIASQ